jgi:heme A synthase
MASRNVLVAALLAAVVQVTLGGVVRVSGSGLGCPDWPLCHGRLIPPFELEPLIEYTHRLSASALGVLALAATGLTWRDHRREPGVTVPTTAALILVFVAAVLGGISVLRELEWWVVTVHLGIAEMVVGLLAVATVAGWSPAVRSKGESADAHGGARVGGPGLPGWLVIFLVAGTFGLMLLGSYMVGRGYGSACGTWPLCRGSLLPEGEAYAVHMLHRYAGALVGVLIAWAAVSAWSNRALRPEIAWASLAAAGVYLAQTILGAATVWSGFAPALRALHLSLATVLWVSVVLLGSLVWVRPRHGAQQAGHTGPRVPGLGRVST